MDLLFFMSVWYADPRDALVYVHLMHVCREAIQVQRLCSKRRRSWPTDKRGTSLGLHARFMLSRARVSIRWASYIIFQTCHHTQRVSSHSDVDVSPPRFFFPAGGSLGIPFPEAWSRTSLDHVGYDRTSRRETDLRHQEPRRQR